jgi:PAS domain S-box-containing protein
VFDENGLLTHYIFVHNDITEIKKDDEIARLELERRISESTRESREAAERLRTVFDTTIDGALVLNEFGIIQDLNHSLELMFGSKKEQLLGKHFSVLSASDDDSRKEHEQPGFFKKEIRTLIGRVRTLKGRHKRGSIITIEVSAGEALLEDEHFFVVAIRDITEQQKIKKQQLVLQEKLKERETIYRTAFDQAAVGIARIALDGQLIEVNQKICTNLGYSESELLTLGVSDISHPDDISISRDYLQDLIQGKQQFHTVEKRYVRKSGTVFWANFSTSLVRNNDGSPRYFISVIEDITERKRFEDELRSARDHKEELIRGINLASEAGGICNWSFNTTTGEMHWDPSTYELYGVEKGLPLTLSDWRCRVVEEDGLRMDSIIDHAIKNDLPIESEFRFTRKGENDIRWAKVAAATVYDERNNPIKMFGINIDITEQKRITLELERETIAAQKANEAKSSFLATMSHEIRTPMNGVIGMIDLLKKTTLNADQKRMVTTVRDSSFSLLEIIDDILDFSKIESGQIEIEWRPNSLLEVMEKTSGNLWVNAEKNGVDLVIEPDLSMPRTIAMDSLRIRQIILNLTGNAIKFSRNDDKRGLVRMVSEFDHTNKSLTIRIIDNGIGIAPEQLRSLFTPFSQADSSTTRKYGGTGLGLSITKSFAGLMGGEVNVESEVGIGSEFSVTIPITEIIDDQPQYELSMFEEVDVFISISKPCFSDACFNILNQLGVKNISMLDAPSDLRHCQFDSKQRSILICDQDIDSIVNREQVLALQIDDDPISRKGYVNPYHFVVAAHPLKPSELVNGLGVLCGLISPDFGWSNEQLDTHSSSGTSMLDQMLTKDKKVLVVEDHPTNQLVIGKQLDSLGIAHDIADDGVEGLKLWHANQYDLVLSDCHMPNMDGFEFTAKIREFESQKSLQPIPIIAITANALVGEADNCLQAGMSDYISKPVEIEVLRTKLSQWLKTVVERPTTTRPELDADTPNRGLNLEILFGVIGTDDNDIVSEILQMYWESIQVEVDQIEQAALNNEPAKLRSLAHASKGSSASSGASYLSDLFKQIEHNNEDSEFALTNLKLIRDELTDIETQLQDLSVLQ